MSNLHSRSMNRRKFVTIAVAGGGALTLGGSLGACDGNGGGGAGKKQITVAPIADFACSGDVYLMEEGDLLAKEGVDAKYVHLKSTPAIIEAYLAGEVDVGLIGSMACPMAVSRGIEAWLLDGYHKGGLGFAVSNQVFKDGATDLAKFAEYAKERKKQGRQLRFGTQVEGTTSELVAIMTLRDHGVSEDDVKLIRTGIAELSSGLIAGNLDAISLCEEYPSVPEVEGKGVVIGSSVSPEGPSQLWGGNFAECAALMVRPSLPDDIRQAVINANREALRRQAEKQDWAINALKKHSPIGRESALMAYYFRTGFVGGLDVRSLQEQVQTVHDLGRIPRVPDLEEYIDPLAETGEGPWEMTAGAQPPKEVTTYKFRKETYEQIRGRPYKGL